MSAPPRQRWILVALLVGAAYLLIGRVFALPSSNVRVGRLAAWALSGVVFAAHLGYEHFMLRHSPRTTAMHAAVGVAIGAFALAVAGALHSLSTTSGIRPLWFLALVLWPAFTAVPAFFVALVAGKVLARLSRRPDAE